MLFEILKIHARSFARLFDEIFSGLESKVYAQPFRYFNSHILELPTLASRLYYWLTQIEFRDHVIANHVIPRPSLQIGNVRQDQISQI